MQNVYSSANQHSGTGLHQQSQQRHTAEAQKLLKLVTPTATPGSREEKDNLLLKKYADILANGKPLNPDQKARLSEIKARHTETKAATAESPSSTKSAAKVEQAQRRHVVAETTQASPVANALLATLDGLSRVMKPLLVLAVITEQFGRAEGAHLRENTYSSKIRQLAVQDCNLAIGNGAKFECLTTGLNSVSSDVDTLKIDVASLETFQEEQILLNEGQAATNLAVQQQLTDLDTSATTNYQALWGNFSDYQTQQADITADIYGQIDGVRGDLTAFSATQNATNIAVSQSIQLAQTTLQNAITTLEADVDDRFSAQNATNIAVSQSIQLVQTTLQNAITTLEIDLDSRFSAQNATNIAVSQSIQMAQTTLQKAITTLEIDLDDRFSAQNATNIAVSQSIQMAQTTLQKAITTLEIDLDDRFSAQNATNIAVSDSIQLVQTTLQNAITTLGTSVDDRFATQNATNIAHTDALAVLQLGQTTLQNTIAALGTSVDDRFATQNATNIAHTDALAVLQLGQTTLQNTIAALGTSVDDRFATQNATNIAHTDALAVLQLGQTTLQNTIAALGTSVDDRFATQNATLSEIKADVMELGRNVTTISETLSDVISLTIPALVATDTQLARDLTNVTTQFYALKIRVDNVEIATPEEVTALRNDFTALNATVSTLSTTLLDRVSTLETNDAEKEARIITLQESLSTLRAEFDAVKDALGTMETNESPSQTRRLRGTKEGRELTTGEETFTFTPTAIYNASYGTGAAAITTTLLIVAAIGAFIKNEVNRQVQALTLGSGFGLPSDANLKGLRESVQLKRTQFEGLVAIKTALNTPQIAQIRTELLATAAITDTPLTYTKPVKGYYDTAKSMFWTPTPTDILQEITDANNGIQEYIDINTEEREPEDQVKYAKNLAILTKYNRPNSLLATTLTGLTAEINGVITEAQERVAANTENLPFAPSFVSLMIPGTGFRAINTTFGLGVLNTAQTAINAVLNPGDTGPADTDKTTITQDQIAAINTALSAYQSVEAAMSAEITAIKAAAQTRIDDTAAWANMLGTTGFAVLANDFNTAKAAITTDPASQTPGNYSTVLDKAAEFLRNLGTAVDDMRTEINSSTTKYMTRITNDLEPFRSLAVQQTNSSDTIIRTLFGCDTASRPDTPVAFERLETAHATIATIDAAIDEEIEKIQRSANIILAQTHKKAAKLSEPVQQRVQQQLTQFQESLDYINGASTAQEYGRALTAAKTLEAAIIKTTTTAAAIKLQAKFRTYLAEKEFATKKKETTAKTVVAQTVQNFVRKQQAQAIATAQRISTAQQTWVAGSPARQELAAFRALPIHAVDATATDQAFTTLAAAAIPDPITTESLRALSAAEKNAFTDARPITKSIQGTVDAEIAAIKTAVMTYLNAQLTADTPIAFRNQVEGLAANTGTQTHENLRAALDAVPGTPQASSGTNSLLDVHVDDAAELAERMVRIGGQATFARDVANREYFNDSSSDEGFGSGDEADRLRRTSSTGLDRPIIENADAASDHEN